MSGPIRTYLIADPKAVTAAIRPCCRSVEPLADGRVLVKVLRAHVTPSADAEGKLCRELPPDLASLGTPMGSAQAGVERERIWQAYATGEQKADRAARLAGMGASEPVLVDPEPEIAPLDVIEMTQPWLWEAIADERENAKALGLPEPTTRDAIALACGAGPVEEGKSLDFEALP
jgi:hypothetical protein